jgi:hypothetical protein
MLSRTLEIHEVCMDLLDSLVKRDNDIEFVTSCLACSRKCLCPHEESNVPNARTRSWVTTQSSQPRLAWRVAKRKKILERQADSSCHHHLTAGAFAKLFSLNF